MHSFIITSSLNAFEEMVFHEGKSVILDVVYFGSKLYALVLLASDDRTDVRAANADNALLYFLFESECTLMVIYLLIETKKVALRGDNDYMDGVYLQIVNHCPIFLESKPSMPIEKFVTKYL